MQGRTCLVSLAGWLVSALVAGPWAGPGWAQTLPIPRPVPDGPHQAMPAAPPAMGLADLIQVGLDRNPALKQAGLDVDAAEGRAKQAGLPLNPRLDVLGEEIGPRGGIHSVVVSQEIQTGGKRKLSSAVARKEVDQAALALTRQRIVLFTTARQGFFEVLTAQRRLDILTELVRTAEQSLESAEKLRKAQELSRLDVLPFQVELDRLRADQAAAQRERVAAWQRLTASIGAPELPCATLLGSLEAPLPDYDVERACGYMLDVNPEVERARAGVARAEFALQRAQAEACPNVTLGGGYSQNFNDRENQGRYGVSIPIPIYNRNQGNIHAAQAELGRSIQEVDRVRNDLLNRLATAFGLYSGARERAQRYHDAILPNALEAYRLSRQAFKGGQFQYLQVLQAQRSVAEANLEYIRALSEAWRAASEIAGLLMEEHWPAAADPSCVGEPKG